MNRIKSLYDNFCKWLAWLLPRRLVMWATVRLFAHATQGEWGNQIVPDLLAMDALKRWERPNTGSSH